MRQRRAPRSAVLANSIVPPATYRNPAIAWISSAWLLPLTPAMPTISPCRIST
ncbi:MAG: hypothetical protein M9905_04255 [Rhizobiaceae bacterium]|nr:hypothetical protein [Rhizobiaceae bacterium]